MLRLRETALRPSTWVALTVLMLPLSSSSADEGTAVTLSDAVVVVLVAVAARDFVQGRNAAAARSVPALLFWVLGTASLVLALAARNFPENVIGGVRFVQLFCLLPIAVMIALRSRRDAQVVLGSVVGLALVQGAIGCFQALTGTGAEIGGESVRAVGTFGAYNIGALAALCGVGLLVALALAVGLPGTGRWWALAAAGALALPLAFALSRGAWVATAAAALVVVSRGRPVRLLALVGGAGALGAVALPVLTASGGELGERLTSLLDVGSDPDQSFVDRLALWRAAGQMALDHPWTGVGPHAFLDHRDAYAGLRLLGSSDISQGSDFQQVALESPHNFYLLVASELGLVAAALFVVAFLVLLSRGLVRAARPRSDASTAVALAGTGTLAFAVVTLLTGDLGGPWSVLLGVCLGLAGWAAADQELVDDDAVVPDRPLPAEPGSAELVGSGRVR
ncbi:O-antigen ligase family protein [Blastococcus sp. TF02A_35]|uniref:O-antigen ligase family protein n=1 Tax=Blastococcus sp. TF02A-35 TaxID=2559612 RepID=UPI0010740976|nr:O-antigen ligase family protein [Blastococcus sp. TF02A_35]TFV53698.1 O-antigen ligase family protein [Blastococcus sp. TF02A_35]